MKLVKYFGSSTIVASIENYKKKNGDYYCSIDFGREETQLKLDEWLVEIQDRGVGEINCNFNRSRWNGQRF